MLHADHTYKELFNKTDGLTRDILRLCLDYTNKQLLTGKSPRLVAFAYRVYRNARLLENAVRTVSNEVYNEKLMPIYRLEFGRFLEILDPAAKNLMNQKYKERSPFWTEKV